MFLTSGWKTRTPWSFQEHWESSSYHSNPKCFLLEPQAIICNLSKVDELVEKKTNKWWSLSHYVISVLQYHHCIFYSFFLPYSVYTASQIVGFVSFSLILLLCMLYNDTADIQTMKRHPIIYIHQSSFSDSFKHLWHSPHEVVTYTCHKGFGGRSVFTHELTLT